MGVVAGDASGWDSFVKLIEIGIGIVMTALLGLLGIAWNTKADQDTVDERFAELRGLIIQSQLQMDLKLSESRRLGVEYMQGAMATFVEVDSENDKLRMRPTEDAIIDIKKSIEAIFRKLDK